LSWNFDIPKPLLDHLKKSFPLRAPKADQSDREIWMEAGRQDLINRIEQWHKAIDAKESAPLDKPIGG
jgi:hypothetical protein